MPNVLELTRSLTGLVEIDLPNGVRLRTFGDGCNDCDDVTAWLDLRRRAFAKEHPAVRDWTATEFAREFTSKPWWQPQHCWFAVKGDNAQVIASAMLATRTGRNTTQAVLHWLMVDPQHRRRGIGQALLHTVENRAWQVGHQSLSIETHTNWQSSVQLYKKCEYQ
jgi:GNAT superfamily N-acetyltransferase